MTPPALIAKARLSQRRLKAALRSKPAQIVTMRKVLRELRWHRRHTPRHVVYGTALHFQELAYFMADWSAWIDMECRHVAKGEVK